MRRLNSLETVMGIRRPDFRPVPGSVRTMRRRSMSSRWQNRQSRQTPVCLRWKRCGEGAGRRVLLLLISLFFAALQLSIASRPAVAQTTPDSRGPERVHFIFAPQDGEEWLEEFQDDRTEDFDQRAPIRRQQTSEIDTLRYYRNSDGWTVARVFGRGTVLVNGEEAETQVLHLFQGSIVEIHCDAQGRALRVKGYRHLMRKLERNLDLDSWRTVQSNLNAKSAERSEIRRWNQRLQGVIGADAITGEVWGYRDFYPIGKGQVEVRGKLEFFGEVEVYGHRGYKLVYEFGSGGGSPEAGNPSVQLDLRPPDATGNFREDVGLRGKVIRVIEPATGHVLYENTEVSWDQPRPEHVGGLMHVRQQTIYRLRPLAP